jgi:PAS domain S-box-containing protein
MEITERKRAEALLRQAHERVEMILDSITDQFFAFDRDWRFTYVNPHAAAQMKVLGKDPARLIGRVLWEEFPDVPNEAAVRRVMAERVAVTDELYYAPLGEWVENRIYPSPDGGIAVFQPDVTERKRAEAQLAASARRFRLVADAIPHLVWSCLPDGTMDYCNQRWVEYTGLTVEDTQDYGWTTCLHPDDVDPAVQAWREAEAHRTPYEVEERVRGRDGRYRRFLSRAVPLYDEQGQLLQWFGTCTEIEARKQAEEALLEAQAALAHVTRLTTLGELTASIAHEVNQPLTAVINNGSAGLRWLTRETPELEAVREALRAIIVNGHRAGDVIARIRALAQRTAPQKAWLDLNAVIHEVLTLVRGKVHAHRVSLLTDLSATLAPVLADRVHVQQVLLNLLMNGIEAMHAVTDRPRELRIRSQRHEADAVRVAVQDTGIGLDPHTVDRLFDAFVTTKPDGMGLGLSICRTLIEAHGGRLWASPNDGPGATFLFTLPMGANMAGVRVSRLNSPPV